VQIRTATPHDAPVVRSIIHEVYVGGGWADPQRSPSYVAELLDAEARIAGATVLVAEDDGRAIGTATATQAPSHLANIARPGELEVRMLGVVASARGKGVARALMGWCEKLAVERGMQAVVLTTEPNMTQARRLYEGLGYLRTPQRDWTINGVGLITYRRDLSKAWPE
jgi:ribosomal protein S18 acetylase RimI-like enzyme